MQFYYFSNRSIRNHEMSTCLIMLAISKYQWNHYKWMNEWMNEWINLNLHYYYVVYLQNVVITTSLFFSLQYHRRFGEFVFLIQLHNNNGNVVWCVELECNVSQPLTDLLQIDHTQCQGYWWSKHMDWSMVGALDSCCIGWNVDNVRLKDVGYFDI